MTGSPPVNYEVFDEMHRLVAASLGGNMSRSEGVRLEELVGQGIEACDLYLNLVCESSILLTWAIHGGLNGEQLKELTDNHAKGHQPNATPVPIVSPPPLSFFSTTLHGAIGYFSEGMPLAYLLATVVTGLALFIGSLIHVSRPGQVARNCAPSVAIEPKFVGRITGMVDCKWNGSSHVSLGQQCELASGLMEITYDTGAKVILQGPVMYEVESNGGYLAVGKLTGKLEKKNDECKMMNDELRTHVSDIHPSSFILHPFSIRTPTATVTDLGTEFGVEVREFGVTDAHVFQGEVEVTPAIAGGEQRQPLRLGANESVRIDRTKGAVRHVAGARAAFVRRMPEPSRLLFRDTFNNKENADAYVSDDCGLNRCCLTVRQSGLYWPLSYSRGGCYASTWYMAQVSHPVCPGKLNLFADYGQAGWVLLDRSLPRNVAVSVELDPDALRCADKGPSPKTVRGDLTSRSWMALSVRGQKPADGYDKLPLAPDAGAVLAVQSNGIWRYSENGLLIYDGSVSPSHPYRVVMRVIDEELDIQINGSALNLGPNRSGSVRTLTGRAADTSENYISIGACNTDVGAGSPGTDLNTADNLTITEVRQSPRNRQDPVKVDPSNDGRDNK